MNRILLVVVLGASLVLGACSSVSVHKVDPETGKVLEGSAEGVHYFMPRPYVAVTEPFVIWSETYLARGELTPDANYVLITDAPDALKKLVSLPSGRQTMGPLVVPSSTVIAAEETGSGSPQGAPASGSNGTKASASTPTGSGADKNENPPKDGSEKPKTEPASGATSNKVVNDTTALMVTPLPRYFNILWLPDWEQEYVISTKQGFGKASATISLGQGWALQSLEATVDNSAITQPLLDFYSGTLGALQKLATSKITAPLAAITGSAQGAPVSRNRSAAQFAGGTPVTVKITLVRMVAPGIYKILKPKEMTALQTPSGEQKKHLLVPTQPLTNIPFNTYETFVIEAARATGDNAFHALQNSETTNGTAKVTTGGGDTPNKPGSAPTTDFNAAVKELNKELASAARTTTNHEYYVATLTQPVGVVKVALKKTSGGVAGNLAALPTGATLQSFVTDFLAAKGVAMDEANVTVSQ